MQDHIDKHINTDHIDKHIDTDQYHIDKHIDTDHIVKHIDTDQYHIDKHIDTGAFSVRQLSIHLWINLCSVPNVVLLSKW